VVGTGHEVGEHAELVAHAGAEIQLAEGGLVFVPEAHHAPADAVQQGAITGEDFISPLRAGRRALRPCTRDGLDRPLPTIEQPQPIS
jgi:hypothetical protein